MKLKLLVSVLTHKSSLTPPLFLEVPVTSHEREQSCICFLVVSILLLSAILIVVFGIVSTVWYFLLRFSSFYSNIENRTAYLF